MPHDTITPQQQLAYEGLLHIQSLNKTPMTPRQAVDACREFSKSHTFIANERTGWHISSFGNHSDVSDYSISMFDHESRCVRFVTNKSGFDGLVGEIELFFHPLPLKKD